MNSRHADTATSIMIFGRRLNTAHFLISFILNMRQSINTAVAVTAALSTLPQSAGDVLSRQADLSVATASLDSRTGEQTCGYTPISGDYEDNGGSMISLGKDEQIIPLTVSQSDGIATEDGADEDKTARRNQGRRERARQLTTNDLEAVGCLLAAAGLMAVGAAIGDHDREHVA